MYRLVRDRPAEVLTFSNTRKMELLSHSIFNRYPARSIHLVPRMLLDKTDFKNNIVLDPFMGSGTTAVEARLAGYRVYGVEVDRFARLVASLKCEKFSNKALKNLYEQNVLINKNFKKMKADIRHFPDLRNIDYWFDKKQFQDLLKLKTAIYLVCQETRELNFFKVVLASIIRPCSLAERQTLKPYISKKYKKIPADVGSIFDKTSVAYIQACANFSKKVTGRQRINWIGNDATTFTYDSEDIDIAITSPPYMNAIDYVRCVKLESAWADTGCDNDFSKTKKLQLGEAVRSKEVVNKLISEILAPYHEEISRIDKKRAQIVLGYFEDIYNNLRCVNRSLRKGGTYNMIIGNSTIRGVYIPVHQIVATIASELGYHWTHHLKYRIKDHRTSIPRKGNGGKINMEHVIVMKKVSNINDTVVSRPTPERKISSMV